MPSKSCPGSLTGHQLLVSHLRYILPMELTMPIFRREPIDNPERLFECNTFEPASLAFQM
jgi:hypothetical protein